MGTYTDQTRLEARFSEAVVRRAQTFEGAGSSALTDPAVVENAITRVEAKVNGMLKAGGFSPPITDPNVPENLRDPVELLAILQLRLDCGGGNGLSESQQKLWDQQIDIIQGFIDGKLTMDGQATSASSGILTNNDDGRDVEWRDYHHNSKGEIVETDPCYFPTLEKIL